LKRAKRTFVILSLALASCRAPVATPTLTPHTVSVRLLATTATAPLLQDLAAAYTHPGILVAFNTTVTNWRTVQSRLMAGDA